MVRISRRRVLGGLALVTGGLAGSLLSSCVPLEGLPADPTPFPTLPWATPAPAVSPTAGATSTAAPTIPPPLPTTTPLPSSYGPATIALWHRHPEWKNASASVIQAFRQEYPGITVAVTTSSDGFDQLRATLAAASGPDIFETPARLQLDALVKGGQLLDLSFRLDRSAWTDLAEGAVTVNRKLWAVPVAQYIVGIAYHRAAFEKAKIANPPRTWAELTEAFGKLKEANLLPYASAARDGSLISYDYFGLASSALGPDGVDRLIDGRRKFTDPDLVDAVKQLTEWAKFFEPNVTKAVFLEAKALFTTGRAAAMAASSIDLDGFRQVDASLSLGFLPWPAPDRQRSPCTNRGLRLAFGVRANSKEVDAASALARWLGTASGARAATEHLRILSLVAGVTPKDPLQEAMLATPLALPVWPERPVTGQVGKVWMEKCEDLFAGRLSPAAFASLLQQGAEESAKLA